MRRLGASLLLLLLLLLSSSPVRAASSGRWIAIGASRAKPLRGGRELWKTITHELARAKGSIEIESRTLRNPEVLALLLRKLDDGVAVRIIAMDPRVQYKSKPNNKAAVASTLDAIRALRGAGAELSEYPLDLLQRETKALSPENHRKLMIVDRSRAIVSTTDLTPNTSNFDLGLLLEGPVVHDVADVFRADHLRATRAGKAPPSGSTLTRSPELALLDGRALKPRLLELVERSSKQILIGAYDLSDRDLLARLVQKKRALPSIDIKVLLGPHRLTSRFLGVDITRPMNAEAYRLLSKSGIDVVWASAKGLAPVGPIFHAKVAVIDGRDLVLGSTDFNKRSFHGNHELSVVVEDQPALAAQFRETLLGQLQGALRGPLHTRFDRIKGAVIDRCLALAGELASLGRRD